ncbi:MAG: carboxypeptidase-like regulatory domain-containing protein [Myxococcota bacterium]
MPDRRIERREDFVLVLADRVLTGRISDPVSFPVRGAQVRIDRGPAAALGRTAVADEHGRYELVGLPPGEYRLVVSHPDFPRHRAAASTERPADITIPFGGRVTGWIGDAHTGAAITGAEIRASGPGQQTVTSASGEGGVLALGPLPAGTWTLAVRAPGYVPQRATLALSAGSEPGQITVRDLRVELARGARVAGVVRDRYGERVAGAVVHIGAARAVTDEDGRYQLRDVITGAVEVRAERGEQRGAVAATLSPGDERVSLDIALGEPERPGDSRPGSDGPGDDRDDDDEGDEGDEWDEADEADEADDRTGDGEERGAEDVSDRE